MKGKQKIAVIEDDRSILNFLTISLSTNGYDVISAGTGVGGISLFLSENPDLILLDLGLPDIDGLSVIAQIRSSSDTPIIVVSARGQEQEKIEALDRGADDFITKPFYIGELLARVRVALRKKQPKEATPEVFALDSFRLDFSKRRVFVDDAEIHLTPIEFKLLCVLVENAGKVLTHGFLIKAVWGYSDNDDSQSLRVFMANLRRKIEKNTADPKYIRTEVGVGYRFAEK
ncbi:MAG: response regulator transcription factor [Eubacteriales bacterium]|nr:response regulator transcription factor [Eubacteriales bacterium]